MEWDATEARWKAATRRLIGDVPFPPPRPADPADPVPDDPAEDPPEETPLPPLPNPMPDRL